MRSLMTFTAFLLALSSAIEVVANQPKPGSGPGLGRFGRGIGERGGNRSPKWTDSRAVVPDGTKGQITGDPSSSYDWNAKSSEAAPLKGEKTLEAGAGQGDSDAPSLDRIILNPQLHQPASSLSGQEPGTEGIKPGQAASATDNSNFINFCQGSSTLTNGMQVTDGSCNGIPMGRLPAVTNMISAIIISPKPGQVINANTTFDVAVQTRGLNAGHFVNPTTNYYSAPQDLDEQGNIIGHCHITIQEIGSFEATTPPDPSVFAHFKGVDDAGNGRGLLTHTVTDGLGPGIYRVCTMIAAQNHQPVNMPVAQRGAQDDCTKFEIRAKGNKNTDGNSKKKNDKNPSKNQAEMGKIRNGNEANRKTKDQKKQRGPSKTKSGNAP